MHPSFTATLLKWFFDNFHMFANTFGVLSIHCVARGLGASFLYKWPASRGGFLQQHGLLVVIRVDIMVLCSGLYESMMSTAGLKFSSYRLRKQTAEHVASLVHSAVKRATLSCLLQWWQLPSWCLVIWCNLPRRSLVMMTSLCPDEWKYLILVETVFPAWCTIAHRGNAVVILSVCLSIVCLLCSSALIK